MTNSPEVFYLHLDGAQRGPYTIRHIDHLLNSGLIAQETLYWREGLEQWQPVTELVVVRKTPNPWKKLRWVAVVLVGLAVPVAIFGPVVAEGWREANQHVFTENAAYWRARDVVRNQALPAGALVGVLRLPAGHGGAASAGFRGCPLAGGTHRGGRGNASRGVEGRDAFRSGSQGMDRAAGAQRPGPMKPPRRSSAISSQITGSLLLALLIAFADAQPVRAQTAAVGEAEVQRCEERIASVQRDVLMKYDEALAELQTGFQKAADLENALIVRAERERAAKDQALTEKNFVPEPRAVRTLQAQTLAKSQELIAQLLSDTLPKLIELKKQLTVAGKLDDAVGVRSAIEKLQNTHLPAVRPEPGAVVAAEMVLVAFAGDRARAEKIYKGQKITVRGVVGGYRQDPGDGRNYQVFVTGGSSGGWVQCTFLSGENRFREERGAFNSTVLVINGKDNDAGSVRVQKGSSIEVRGVCEGWDETVRMGHCEIPR